MIYLDSSALFKLVRAEAETPGLIEWLHARRAMPRVTSELGRIEVLRAARRAGPAELAEATALLGEIDLVPLHRHVQDLACTVGAPPLRTLDALHLASAIVIQAELTAFVAFDHRLVDAARTARLPVVTPGMP